MSHGPNISLAAGQVLYKTDDNVEWSFISDAGRSSPVKRIIDTDFTQWCAALLSLSNSNWLKTRGKIKWGEIRYCLFDNKLFLFSEKSERRGMIRAFLLFWRQNQESARENVKLQCM